MLVTRKHFITCKIQIISFILNKRYTSFYLCIVNIETGYVLIRHFKLPAQGYICHLYSAAVAGP